MPLKIPLPNILLTLLIPPLPVLLTAHTTPDLALNILLTLLAWIPGVIHALYIQQVYYTRREVITSPTTTACPALPSTASPRLSDLSDLSGSLEKKKTRNSKFRESLESGASFDSAWTGYRNVDGYGNGNGHGNGNVVVKKAVGPARGVWSRRVQMGGLERPVEQPLEAGGCIGGQGLQGPPVRIELRERRRFLCLG